MQKANSGHPGCLWVWQTSQPYYLNTTSGLIQNPNWINRDRFVLSAGHGSMLLYSLLHLTGYEMYQLKILKILDSLIQFVPAILNMKKVVE